MKYQKKPVVIEAMQYLREENIAKIQEWFAENKSSREIIFNPEDNEFYIVTLEGEMKASKFDWIIKGVSGEFYPCKPDIFETTYEKVEGQKNYRKKPVVIEAFQYDGDFIYSNGKPYVPQWVMDGLESGVLSSEDQGNMYVYTLEGRMLVNVGDFIIKGVQGELYPCKPDIFELTYEKVEE